MTATRVDWSNADRPLSHAGQGHSGVIWSTSDRSVLIRSRVQRDRTARLGPAQGDVVESNPDAGPGRCFEGGNAQIVGYPALGHLEDDLMPHFGQAGFRRCVFQPARPRISGGTLMLMCASLWARSQSPSSFATVSITQ